jgi:hypothetical protein
VSGIEGTIAEGEEGAARIVLGPPKRPGPIRVAVRVFSDGTPPHDLATLVLRGFVGRGVALRPESLDLGVLEPAAAVARRIEARLPPGREGDEVEASLAGLAGEVTVVAPAVRDGPGGDIVLALRAPQGEGSFEGSVAVRAGGREEGIVRILGRVGRAGGEEGPMR